MIVIKVVNEFVNDGAVGYACPIWFYQNEIFLVFIKVTNHSIMEIFGGHLGSLTFQTYKIDYIWDALFVKSKWKTPMMGSNIKVMQDFSQKKLKTLFPEKVKASCLKEKKLSDN